MQTLSHRRGFTLIELLIVMVVIGILFVIGMFLFNDVRDSSHNTKAKADVRAALIKATSGYIANQNSYGATDAAAAAQLPAGDGLTYVTTSGAFNSNTIYVQVEDENNDLGGEDDFTGDVTQQITLCGESESGQVYCLRANQEVAFVSDDGSGDGPLLVAGSNTAYSRGANLVDTVCALPQPSQVAAVCGTGRPGWGGGSGGGDEGDEDPEGLDDSTLMLVYGDTSGELYSMDPGSANLSAALTDASDGASAARFNSGKTQIVYHAATESGGRNAIWVMDSDGSNKAKIATPPAGQTYTYPSWSPDDTQVMFTVALTTEAAYRWGIQNADGSGSVDVVDAGMGALSSGNWGSDDKVYFFGNDDSDQNHGIWRFNPDGSGAEQLLSGGEYDQPALSPDGTKLAVLRCNGGCQVTVANADGSDPQDITAYTMEESNYMTLAWSPSGNMIGFTVYPDGAGDGEIYTINADGTGLTQITDNGVHDRITDW